MTRYWTDFSLALTTAVVAFLAVGWAGYLSPVGIACYVVSVLAFLRAATFIHEVVHFRHRRPFRSFLIGWNLLCGIPMMIPIFMYTGHAQHHNTQRYGTSQDPDYVPFATLPPARITGLLISSPLVPILGPIRFGILAPAGWLFPSVRRFVYQQASALTIDPDYVRGMPADRKEQRSWTAQEAGCFAVFAVVVALTVTGFIAPARLVEWFVLMAGVNTLSSLRLIGEHRYHAAADGMSIEEQMLDSVNMPKRRWITELWGPIGLRMHALHHLMPGLPYHAYGSAHARLIREFGPESPYASTAAPGLLYSIRRVWRESKASQVA